MLEKLRALAKEYEELHQQMQDPAIAGSPDEIARIGKRIAELEPLVGMLKEYDRCRETVDFEAEAQGDEEMEAFAKEEADKAKERMAELEEEMKRFLVPTDPDDAKSVIIEIRAGTGGEEASLFASELLRMYLRYAEERGWKTELMNKAETEGGGVKEAACKIEGEGVYGELKFESGVHRVQRVPSTESKGRLHTSAASVAILPEAEEVDIQIQPEDIEVDVFRSSGPGGQSVNTTDSAVRISHHPSGITVSCQDEKSQHKNRAKAMNILRSRLYAAERERQARERGDMRSGQIGSGDRSEKIRTYNFPQDRVTDHRLQQNFSNIPAVMDGQIGEILQALKEREREEKLASIGAETE